MFIFDASSLAPLGSRRPSAGASRPRMFGSQENTVYIDLYEDTGRTRSAVTRAEAIDVTRRPSAISEDGGGSVPKLN